MHIDVSDLYLAQEGQPEQMQEVPERTYTCMGLLSAELLRVLAKAHISRHIALIRIAAKQPRGEQNLQVQVHFDFSAARLDGSVSIKKPLTFEVSMPQDPEASLDETALWVMQAFRARMFELGQDCSKLGEKIADIGRVLTPRRHGFKRGA